MGSYNYPYYMEYEKTGEYFFPNAITWRSADGDSLNSLFKKAKKEGYEGNFKEFVKTSVDLGFVNAIGAKEDEATKTAYDAYQALSIKQGKAPLSFDDWYKKERTGQIVSTTLEYGQKTIDILNSIFGKKEAAPDFGNAPAPAPAKSNTGLIVGVSIAVLAVGIGAYFILKDKK